MTEAEVGTRKKNEHAHSLFRLVRATEELSESLRNKVSNYTAASAQYSEFKMR